MSDLKELVADLTPENRLLKKKHARGWERARMKYPASEMIEIIRLVEQSHMSARRTLEKLGVSRPTFYRWYDLYRWFGDAGLQDRRAAPDGSGTGFRRLFAARSSNWHWSAQSSALGNWRSRLLTSGRSSSRNPRFIGC